MTRSRRRKLQRAAIAHRPAGATSRPRLVRTPLSPIRQAVRLAPLLLAGYVPVAVQAQQSPLGLDEIIVTAQKREESLQNVPISVQALGTVKLEQLNVADFEDYANLLPSVSFVTIRPGYAQVYMRGVASAGDADANHSGSLPLIGTYLDEQPITTIQGALDVHLYDIARVEALAGPQGTLYGASSEAGTVKIVTNKPDPTGFAGGYGLEGNYLSGGDSGYLAEGFVNLPMADNMAIRLVGWARHDAGYIDNVPFQRTFPSTLITVPPDGITTDNAARVEDDYNGVDTYGARAALRIDLNDSWTVTPSVMAQKQKADGSFGADNTLGEYQVGHGFAEGSDDKWWQAALTVEGRIGSIDMVYTGSYLDRDVDFDFDYADYSYWYDVAYLADGVNFSSYFYNDVGDAIDFSQYVLSSDRYKKYSQELRFSTPQENRLRALVGAFWQRQEHAIYQDYKINDLAESLSVTGKEDTLWLTEQERIDEDYALFGEVYYDFTEKLTGTVGARWFKYDNSLEGYFGFGLGYSSSGNSGEALCDKNFGDGLPPDGGPNTGADLPDYGSAPCKNLDDSTDDSDSIYKVNLAYKLTDDALIYATYSEGFRPGGINRRGTVPPYKPDFLYNYELGWKSSWLDDRLRFNGAVFYQQWEDFQYSILGPNGLTEVTNAPGDAEITGLEMDVNWAVTEGLGLSAGVAFIDAELSGPYCQNLFGGAAVSADPCPVDGGGSEPPAAPKGTKLPVTPDFKGNITGRYQFPLGTLDAHFQAAVIYVGERETDLRTFENDIVGQLPSYTLTNLSFGAGTGDWAVEFFLTNAFDEYAEFSRYTECPEARCGPQTYSIVAPPRTFGVKFSQDF
ncbi:MAG: TonB-dependent receptor [Chromatiales bacterium]|nr:TonB-dependent receptor [Chromatiales bacterium]